jgi:hypothetical protein
MKSEFATMVDCCLQMCCRNATSDWVDFVNFEKGQLRVPACPANLEEELPHFGIFGHLVTPWND